jgi:gliding motility-associated-like protein
MLKTQHTILISTSIKIALIILFSTKFSFSQLPNSPIIDTISVEPISVKGNVYISWFPVTSPGVKGYIIYRDLKTSLDVPNWINLDTVWGASNTFYLDATSNADGEYEHYILRAFNDSVKSLLSESISTIYIFPYIETENCKNLIRIHWDHHKAWQPTFTHFDIFCSENYQPYQKIGTTTGTLSDFKYFDISNQTSYSFFVRGYYSDGRTFTSNSVRTFTNFPTVTQYLNADFATVENENIKLQFTLDTASDVRNYSIIKSDSINGTYKSIYKINNYLSDKLIYTDVNVDVTKNYFYKLQAVDLCNNSYKESNIAENITIKVKSDKDFNQIITWDKYSTWLGGDMQYKLYRIIEDERTEIYETYYGNAYFADNISLEDLQKVSSNLCYEVIAKEGTTNPYGVQGESKSAKICVEQDAIVHVPEAFTPNGDQINAIFKPTTIFVSPEMYQFLIYDRWGQIIYQTSKTTEGWDGKLPNLKEAPEGTYYYYIKYLDFYKNIYHLSGTATLFRK